MNSRKRILIIHTGGTLGMNLSGSPDDAENFKKSLKQYAPRMFELADVSLEILLNKDSSNMSPRDWITIARRLHERMDEWDGFVVTHGTDTLAFTASALRLSWEYASSVGGRPMFDGVGPVGASSNPRTTNPPP